MSGLLIAEYELSVRKQLGRLPKNGALVKTIVSSDMADGIAKEYGVEVIEVLTGFKYIGEQIKFFEQDHRFEYVFGYEESYGCLVGTHARDKDAVVAVMALCEAAAFCKHQGITLCDKMKELFDTYGYYKEGLCTVTLKGQDGAKKIASMMEGIRGNVAENQWEALTVTQFRDYKEDVASGLCEQEQKPLPACPGPTCFISNWKAVRGAVSGRQERSRRSSSIWA